MDMNPSFFTAGDGTRIAYRIDGPAGAPYLVLSNSIGTTMHMWDRQVPQLAKDFRVLRFDTRGHGASGVPAGAYSLDRLGRDTIELLDALDIECAHFMGLSLGGMIGQWMGIHAPERVGRLILCNTASCLEPASKFDEQIASILRAPDMSAIAEIFLANWFPAWMLENSDPDVEKFRAMLLAMDRQGLAGALAAVRDADLRRPIALIDSPVLVIGGRDDKVTLASHSESIAATVPGSKLVIFPAVHLTNVERPDEFMHVVSDFLLSH